MVRRDVRIRLRFFSQWSLNWLGGCLAFLRRQMKRRQHRYHCLEFRLMSRKILILASCPFGKDLTTGISFQCSHWRYLAGSVPGTYLVGQERKFYTVKRSLPISYPSPVFSWQRILQTFKRDGIRGRNFCRTSWAKSVELPVGHRLGWAWRTGRSQAVYLYYIMTWIFLFWIVVNALLLRFQIEPWGSLNCHFLISGSQTQWGACSLPPEDGSGPARA